MTFPLRMIEVHFYLERRLRQGPYPLAVWIWKIQSIKGQQLKQSFHPQAELLLLKSRHGERGCRSGGRDLSICLAECYAGQVDVL